MQALKQTQLVSQFQCLGEACADTCCKHWSMQVDDATLERYRSQQPELLAAVDFETDGLPVMRRNQTTGECVKLEGGWCGVHKQFGETMLGDACHFYPRVTRALGAHIHMTAVASCPEILRLALVLDEPFAPITQAIERLPSTVRSYLPEGMEADDALATHTVFIHYLSDETIPPATQLLAMSSVARAMQRLDKASWPQALPLYLRLAGNTLPAAEAYQADRFNLLHVLCGLMVATKKTVSPRFAITLAEMENALLAKLDWQQVSIETQPESLAQSQTVLGNFHEASAHYQPLLRRYVQLQLSLSLFPFAGLGDTPEERITFIGVRFAIMQLALACAHHAHGALKQDEQIRVVQSLSRLLDHLGSADFSRAIFTEAGWHKEGRLRALIELQP